MFGKLAADVLGLSDVGVVVKPKDYDKVDADDYVMHEDNEKIYFLIKSKSDEYCFTNLALIHLDGKSATSKKRTLRRFSYHTHKITNVSLETAGTVDLDVEIKFTMGAEHFSIDVNKKHLGELKDLYKALIKISSLTHDNEIALQHARESLGVAQSTISSVANLQADVAAQFRTLNQYAFDWLTEAHEKYVVKDFGKVFETYIHN
ncbi:PH domain-containing protein [Brevibacillus sp. GCM10020057]|uniref:PH domain-containing protein n=1 Tax=Brevibacillus sp. GCM10020057 TaxID=3317327 RepID=UPI003628BB6E